MDDWDTLFPAVGGSQAGGPVYGPQPVVDPYKARDQQLQEEAAARTALEWNATHNPDGTEKPKPITAGEATADQKRIATLLTRIAGGARDISTITGDNASSAAPGFIESVRGDLMPGGIGGLITRGVAGADRRSVHDSQRDVLDALLTLGTGAAYNAEQLSGQMASYFPQFGDSQDEIDLKTNRLLRLIEAAKANAGPAWAQVEPAIAPFMESLTSPKAADAPRAEQEGLSGATTYDPAEWRDGAYVGPGSGGPAPDGSARVTGNDSGWAQIGAGVGDIVQGGLNNTIGLLANPINTTLFRSLGYDNFTSDIGATAREALGLPYGNETIGAINQAAAGGFGGATLANMAARHIAPGLASSALAEYGGRPLMDTITGGTAAASGEAARQMGAGPVGQTLATLAGGATPTAVANTRGGLSSLFTSRTPPDFDPAVVAAGQRQNVPVRMADAVPSSRGEVAQLEASPRGGPIVQAGRAADTARMEQRVAEIGDEGNPSDQFTLGTQVQGAGKRYIDRTRQQKNDRYTRAEQMSGGRRIVPEKAIAAVDRNIAELEAAGANTNAATINYMRQLRDDLAKADGFSITEFQALRSAASKKIRGDQALTSSDADRRLSSVVQEFSADAADQLPEAATNALAEADQFYAQRQDFINGVLRNVMGSRGNPLPAEQAASRLVAMTKGKGDQARFARMWNELAEDERADAAATIALSLGRKANGDFSPATLIRSLDPRSGVNPRTARLIFGREGAQALDDLRVLAQAKTDAAGALNNSRTGNMVTRQAGTIKTVLMGILGFQTGGIPGAVAGGVAREALGKWGEERAARAMMNPDFTRWLRNAPNTSNPNAINAYFKRLELAAAKSPILAADIQGFREAVNDAMNVSPGQLAAAEQENN